MTDSTVLGSTDSERKYSKDMFSDKDLKEAKEIQDIVDEYKKTENLLNQQKWDELQQHISDVLKKHPIEAMIYNAGTVPPMSIQENAVNCMTFLRKLLVNKGIISCMSQLMRKRLIFA